MEDIEPVQGLQPPSDLDERPPYFLLGEGLRMFFFLDNLLVEVTVIGVLHDNAT